MTEPITKKRGWRVMLLVLVAVLCAYIIFAYWGRLPAPSGPPTFEGDSGKLQQTQVVATLDAPMEKGKNVIWCASFPAAWKVLQTDLAKGPVALEGDGKAVEALNQAPNPAPDAPPGSLYAIAGWQDKGILQKITADLKKQFPAKTPPTFPGIVPGSFVAYSYLEGGAKFGMPYFQSRRPLFFKDSNGKQTPISSFGIRPEDDYTFFKLREQPKILYQGEMTRDSSGMGGIRLNCIIDLDRNSAPTQVVLAIVKPKATLEQTLASVEEKIASYKPRESGRGLMECDVLLVPDIFYAISHHFKELEGRHLLNPTLKGQRMDVAQEDIAFRLDRNGAELKAESKMYSRSAGYPYVFKRPFLVYLKKRGADRPYFVMWVDNAELLKAMPGDKAQPTADQHPKQRRH